MFSIIDNKYRIRSANTMIYIIYKYIGVHGSRNMSHAEYILNITTNRNPNNIIKYPSIICSIKK